MKTLFTFFRLQLLIIFLALGVMQPAHSQQPIVGAIRWDAWCHDANTNLVGAPTVGLQVETSLGPSQYHYRVPFFGRETGPNSVTIDGRSQQWMDQEIAYAKEAGIDYWAFVYYKDGSGMDYARNLYNNNSHRDDVKACYILSNQFAINTSNLNWLVTRFQELNYQKVLSGRPLLYIFNSTYTLSDVNAIRTAAQAQGANPYIVVMDPSSTNAKNTANAIGADAISAYVSGAANNGGPYAPLLPDTDRNKWDSHKGTGKKVIPWVTDGWNVKPRIDNPPSWITPGSSTAYVGDGTPQEIGQHLQGAINWVKLNPTTVEANAIIIYSWNEHDEGGAICPTIIPGTGSIPAIDRSRLDGVKAVLMRNPSPVLWEFEDASNGKIDWNPVSTVNGNGSWSLTTDGSQVYQQTNTNGTFRSLAGSASWTNYSLQAKVKLVSGSGVVRLIARYQDESNFYFLEASPTQLSLYERANAINNLLGSAPISLSVNTWYTLKLTLNGASLNAYFNNLLKIGPVTGTALSGRVGVNTFNAKGYFDDVTVTDLDGGNLRKAALETVLEARLTAYPVPARQQLNVLYSATKLGEATLELINTKGVAMEKTSQWVEVGENQLSVEVSHLPAGLYILRVWQADKQLSQKVLITP